MNVHARLPADDQAEISNAFEPRRCSRGRARITDAEALVDDGRGAPVAIGLARTQDDITLRIGSGDPVRIAEAVALATEALTASEREGPRLKLDCADKAVLAQLAAEGLAIGSGEDRLVRPELVWQRSSLWLPEGDRTPFPEFHVLSAGRRHPARPPKPRGVVYERAIPWLERALRFRALDIDRDLPAFNCWMNDPRVDVVWEEAGDLETHRRSLQERAADPHLITLIGEFDGAPFGYFELYWAKENRLGPLYDADDYDRGWHVLIGEDAFRGRDFITAWLPSLMHYMFLSDPRTRRIVGEPRWTHAQQIRNLDKAGFSKVKHVDFAHKRALLVMLLRERFFGDRLWAPEKAQG